MTKKPPPPIGLHRFLESCPAEPTPLQTMGTFGVATHLWEQEQFDALAVAGFSGRPLLIKGEPGTGKTQLARAAAALLGWRLEYEVITPRTEPQELLWRFDAVRRLAEAHGRNVDDEKRYVSPGVMWRALDPSSAAHLGLAHDNDLGGSSEVDQRSCVVLLDEIDKADSDLPNSLLEVLGNRSFTTPWRQQVPSPGAPSRELLVIITSNDERELPLAFLRRCAVLDLKVPDERDEAGFLQWLQARGQAQFSALDPRTLAEAARLVRKDRLASPEGQGARPGLAEYLDLLRALDQIAPSNPGRPNPTKKHLELLRRLSPYVLRKQGQDQTPEALPRPDGDTE